MTAHNYAVRTNTNSRIYINAIGIAICTSIEQLCSICAQAQNKILHRGECMQPYKFEVHIISQTHITLLLGGSFLSKHWRTSFA